MTIPKEFRRELRDLAYVPRWAIARTIRQQYVIEHQYFVTVYAMAIARAIDYQGDMVQLIEYCLWHDVEETITGDITGPAKKGIVGPQAEKYLNDQMEARFGDLVEPTADMLLIRKLADMTEQLIYLAGERQLGNRAIEHMWDQSWGLMTKAVKNLPATDDQKQKLLSDIYRAANEEGGHMSKLVE